MLSKDHANGRSMEVCILTILLLHADIDDAPQDTPGVVHGQVDLRGELVRLELLRAQDDVARVVAHLRPGHVTELDLVRAG